MSVHNDISFNDYFHVFEILSNLAIYIQSTNLIVLEMTFSVNNENEFNPVNSLILMKYPRLNPHSFTITKATFPCIKSFHFKVVFVQTLVLFSIIFIEEENIYICIAAYLHTPPQWHRKEIKIYT